MAKYTQQVRTLHSKQSGFVSTLLAVMLSIGLCVTGYFLHSSYATQETLTAELEKTKRKLRTSERSLRDSESSLRDQESQLSSLNSQRNRLKTEMEAIEQELAEVQKRNDTSQVNFKESLKETTEKLQAALSEKESAYSEKAKEYQNKLTELSEFSESIKQKYASTQEALEDERLRNQNFTATIETLEQRLAREQQALNNLNEKLTSLDEQNTDLNKQNAMLNSEKNRLIKQFKDGTTIIRLDNTILFPTGSATLNKRGKETLELVSKTLASFPQHRISVEGHTDHRPIMSSLSEKYPSNWELSAARASFAIRYLTQQGLPASQFQAVGYGSTRPITKEGDLTKNRRIEILLYPPTENITVNALRVPMKKTLSSR